MILGTRRRRTGRSRNNGMDRLLFLSNASDVIMKINEFSSPETTILQKYAERLVFRLCKINQNEFVIKVNTFTLRAIKF